MQKSLLLALFFMLMQATGFTQNYQDLDSLKHRLSIEKMDSNRVWQLVSIADVYRSSNRDSALFYAEKAVALGKQIKFYPGLIWAMAVYGAIFNGKGNLPKALEIEFSALKIAEDNNYLQNSLGPIIFIGRIYITLKDYTKALYYGYLEKEWADQLKSEDSKIYARENLASIYEQMNRLDSALFYLRQADTLRVNVLSVRSYAYHIYGNIYFKSGNIPLALEYYYKSLQYGYQNNNYWVTSVTCIDMARLYKKENQQDSAIHYAQQALTEAKLISQSQIIFEASTMLSDLYEPKNIKEAFSYYKLATNTKDSLFGAGNMQALQTMVVQEETRQKDIENAKISYQNKLKQYALAAGLGIMLLIGFFLWRNNKKEKAAKNQLQQKNKIIEQTLANLKSTQSQLIQSEKMASLGELTAGIAHEIQNPLNFVNNFSEVNTELIDEMQQEMSNGNIEDAKAISNDIKENEKKINQHGKRADAIVKGMLQHSQSSSGIKEPTDINKLADEYLRLAYHGLQAKDNSFTTILKTDFDENIGNINIIPQDIGRVLLNLYNNAFYTVVEKKKQNGKGYEPTVSVSTKKVGDKVLISVTDNGNGIPQKILDKIFQPFFTTKPTGQGTGLGLSLAYDIVKAHGGELKVETRPARAGSDGEGEGTTFIITL